jgi:hypothetical protein
VPRYPEDTGAGLKRYWHFKITPSNFTDYVGLNPGFEKREIEAAPYLKPHPHFMLEKAPQPIWICFVKVQCLCCTFSNVELINFHHNF